MPTSMFISLKLTTMGKIYRIKGTFDQWMRFFVMDGMPKANTQRSKNVS